MKVKLILALTATSLIGTCLVEAAPPSPPNRYRRTTIPAQNYQYDTPNPAPSVRNEQEFSVIPKDYRPVKVEGQTYYQRDRDFYRHKAINGRTELVRVDPPIGAVIDKSPNNAERLTINRETYFQSENTFYRMERPHPSATPTYVVARPPIGSVVKALPGDAKPDFRDGRSCFIANGSEYLEVHFDGITRYVVIR